MENLWICENSMCRYVIDLREVSNDLRRAQLLISACPECGHNWASTCPFCSHSLKVVWRDEHHKCFYCNRILRPESIQRTQQGDPAVTGTRGKLHPSSLLSSRSRESVTTTRLRSRRQSYI
jgi:hypothetical protein